MIERSQIVAAARKYLGRPVQHQGRGRTLDCVGLLLATAEDLGLVDVFGLPIRRTDYLQYGSQPVDGFVQRECCRRLKVKIAGAGIEPGDVVTLRLPRVPCHSAIVSEVQGGHGIIHAYPSGRYLVVEHRLDDRWLRRIAGVFSFPERHG